MAAGAPAARAGEQRAGGDPAAAARGGLRLLWPHVRRHWWLPIVTLLALAASSAAQISMAWSLKLVIDAVTAHDTHRLAAAIAFVVGTAIVLPLSQSVMQFTKSVFGGRVARELRDRVFGHLLRVPALFHDARHSGELQTRLSEDVGAVEGMVANDFVNALQQPLLAAASFAYLLVLNGWLALAVAALGPSMYLLNRLWGPGLYARSQRARQAGARLGAFAVDALGGIQAIKALRAEEAVARRYRAVLDEQYAARAGEWGVGNLSGVISGWMSFAPFVIIFALGGLWASQGWLSLGTLMAAVQLMNNVVSPFGNLAGAWRGIQTARASLDRLYELLAAPEEDLGDPSPSGPVSTSPPAITFCGVRFGYDPDHPVLTDATFALPAGAFAAIVGPNGSGKSTLAKLLLGLHGPQSGEIRWNGQATGQLSLAHVRGAIAYLPQEPFLVDASVTENLRLGAPEAAEDDLAAALSAVGLPADAAFLAQTVGERGKRLSGGQRLRLGLARALISKAPVWLLDEPSAALDPGAADALRRTLEGLRGACTVVAITHSSDLAAAADVVIRVEEGRAAAAGA